MLSQLRIVNFAIIEELELQLQPGFTVLTGETGAGKSIIIDAVELLLGGRADTAMLRKEADFAMVEGIFELEQRDLSEVYELLDEHQLVEEAGTIVLARELRREGRNLCRINGRIVSLTTLRQIGEWLVDVHGQSEHLSLLKVPEHQTLLDRFAHLDLDPYLDTYRRIMQVRSEIATLDSVERESARREDLLRYQIREIEDAQLKENEIPELEIERDRLANAEKLAGLALNAIAALVESPGDRSPAADSMGEATSALMSLAEIDPAMAAVSQRSQTLGEEIVGLASELRSYLDEVKPDPLRLNEVESRLNTIHDLRRKYGDGVEDILRYAAKASAELDSIVHAEERLEDLRLEEVDLLTKVAEAGSRISQRRRDASEDLSAAIADHLAELGMGGAAFTVDFEFSDDPHGVEIEDQRVAFGPTGLDRIEFLIAPNPGEGLKPLAKVASGGETSRLMLGLKSVLAKADRRPTLIFDEIDQGIGGRIGSVVGSKLKDLALEHQVLCVTHLPQLAAHADQHYQVDKQVREGRTSARVRALEGDARLEELAEMLGDSSEANRKSAEELLATAALVG